MKKDMTYGFDRRGDYALFIDDAVKEVTGRSTEFFRVLQDGEEQSGHGWIGDEKIIQWG